MPVKPQSPCLAPGCPNAASQRGRCAEHARQYDRRRGTPTERGYGAAWRKRRAAFLAEYPHCVACWREGWVVAATEVDHIVPRQQGGSDEWTNLQALCKPHHSEKTMRESINGR